MPTEVLRGFVDKHRDTYGVEPICKVLQIAPSGYRRHAACRRKPELRCARARRDDTLMPQIQQVWQANMQVYGADKVWRQMRREGVSRAVCSPARNAFLRRSRQPARNCKTGCGHHRRCRRGRPAASTCFPASGWPAGKRRFRVNTGGPSLRPAGWLPCAGHA